MKALRFRYTYMVIGSIAVILLYLLSDPDAGIIQHLGIGASTVATLLFLVKGVLYVTLLHISRKALHDYPEADFRTVITKAVQTSEGAGRVAIALSISTLAAAIVIIGAAYA